MTPTQLNQNFPNTSPIEKNDKSIMNDLIFFVSTKNNEKILEILKECKQNNNLHKILIENKHSGSLWKSIIDNSSQPLLNTFFSEMPKEFLEKLFDLFIANDQSLCEYALVRDSFNSLYPEEQFLNTLIHRVEENRESPTFLHFLSKNSTFFEKTIKNFRSEQLVDFLSNQQQDPELNTFLHLAVINNNFEAIKIIVDKLDSTQFANLLCIKNKEEKIPLALAAETNESDQFFSIFFKKMNTENTTILLDQLMKMSADCLSNASIDKLAKKLCNISPFISDMISSTNRFAIQFCSAALKYMELQTLEEVLDINQNTEKRVLCDIAANGWIEDPIAIQPILQRLESKDVSKLLLREDSRGQKTPLEYLLHHYNPNTQLFETFLPEDNDALYQLLSKQNTKEQHILYEILEKKSINVHSVFLKRLKNFPKLLEIFSLFKKGKIFLYHLMKKDKAIATGYLELIKNKDLTQQLLQLTNNEGNTILHTICNSTFKKNTFNNFLKLLNKNDHIEKLYSIKNIKGKTFLHYLIRKKNVEIWDAILPLLEEKNLTKSLLEIKDNNNQTILHRLTKITTPKLIRSLIEIIKKHDLLDKLCIAKDTEGNTFFSNMIQNKNCILWDAIYPALVEKQLLEDLLLNKNNRQETILHTLTQVASQAESEFDFATPILEYMSKHNLLEKVIFEKNHKDHNFVYYVLNNVEMWNNIAQHLTEKQVEELFTTRDPRRGNIFHQLTRHNISSLATFFPIIQKLGVTIDLLSEQFEDGRTPLHMADLKFIDLVLTTIQRPEDMQKLLSSKDFDEQTFLHVLTKTPCKSKRIPLQLKIIEKVLKFQELETILAEKSSTGSTLLHHAYYGNNLDLVQYFCKHTKPEVIQTLLMTKNLDGDTPLHCAMHRQRKNAIDMAGGDQHPSEFFISTNLLIEWTLKNIQLPEVFVLETCLEAYYDFSYTRNLLQQCAHIRPETLLAVLKLDMQYLAPKNTRASNHSADDVCVVTHYLLRDALKKISPKEIREECISTALQHKQPIQLIRVLIDRAELTHISFKTFTQCNQYLNRQGLEDENLHEYIIEKFKDTPFSEDITTEILYTALNDQLHWKVVEKMLDAMTTPISCEILSTALKNKLHWKVVEKMLDAITTLISHEILYSALDNGYPAKIIKTMILATNEKPSPKVLSIIGVYTNTEYTKEELNEFKNLLLEKHPQTQAQNLPLYLDQGSSQGYQFNEEVQKGIKDYELMVKLRDHNNNK